MTEKNKYDVSEDRCHVCGCHFDGHGCECERLEQEQEEEDEEDDPFILATPRYTWDDETGRKDYLSGWNYDLPEGYRLREARFGAPKNPAFPVFEVKGQKTPTSDLKLIGYACRPVATVVEGEIFPWKPGNIGTLCYSIEGAEIEADKQLAAMEEEGYYD